MRMRFPEDPTPTLGRLRGYDDRRDVLLTLQLLDKPMLLLQLVEAQQDLPNQALASQCSS